MSNSIPSPAISTKLCRYWLNGGCRNTYCPFLHPPHGKDKSSKPCIYFLRGYCGRGANCNFMHAPPSSSQKQPQKNSALPHPINPEHNAQPPQEQNNNPSSSEESSDSDVSFKIIMGDSPSYFLGGANRYGPSNYLTSQIQMEWCGWLEYYNSYESTLHRPSLSGRKRPLEQEAESKIRCTDVGPVKVPCTETHVAHDKGQNGHSSSGGNLSSRLRGRIRFPETSIPATAYHSMEKRDSRNGYPVQHTKLFHSRRNRKRERGFTNRSEINASDFPAPKSLAELKRAKIVKEQNNNPSFGRGK